MPKAEYIEQEYLWYQKTIRYWFEVDLGEDSGMYAKCESPTSSYFVDHEGAPVDSRLIFKLERLCIVDDWMRDKPDE